MSKFEQVFAKHHAVKSAYSSDYVRGCEWGFKAGQQSQQAEVEEKDKKLKAVDQILIELKESMTNFKELDLYDKGVRVVTDYIIRDLEKALRGDDDINVTR